MLVFWKERLILLAVPKTGTTALEGALAPRAQFVLRDPPQIKHAPLYRARRFVVPLIEAAGGSGFETVAAVREPVDWLGSWWRYRQRDDLAGQVNSTRGVGFDDFVDQFARGKPAPYAAVGSQARFVGDGEGNVAVDHLFRYESMDLLVNFLEERLATRIDLPRVNVSPEHPMELPEHVASKLRRKRAAEFSVWEQARA
ncbi:gamma-glutamyl kinase [Limimaricola soesokkakensis]|uniref:gamma-glutamyl kinase n=1 Tax=Limimaricola soesokkakensis TaxID=1343159 RepID=UPI003517FDC6